jgi:hypothetical protein
MPSTPWTDFFGFLTRAVSPTVTCSTRKMNQNPSWVCIPSVSVGLADARDRLRPFGLVIEGPRDALQPKGRTQNTRELSPRSQNDQDNSRNRLIMFCYTIVTSSNDSRLEKHSTRIENDTRSNGPAKGVSHSTPYQGNAVPSKKGL